MKNKIIIIGIVLMFLGASIGPVIIGSTIKKTNNSSPWESFGLQTTWKFFSLNTENGETAKTLSLHPDELSTISLKPENTPQTTRGSSQPLVDNTSISQPMNNDVLRGGDVIEIQGTANGSTFQYYIIEWGVGEYPSTWFTSDIELENDGLLPVVDDTLGTWDTSFVEDEEFLTLRLTVNFSTYTSQVYIRNMCLDPTLKEGWPIRIPFYYDSEGGYYFSVGYLEPVVADINNDGYGEVIIYRPAIPQQLQVYTSEGSLLWSSDVGAPESGNGDNVMLPVIDDINHDGFLEIIVYRFLSFQNYCELYVFDHNGSVLDGWPIQLPKEYHPTMLAADVNNDGYDEIIFKGNDAWDIMLSIVDYTGTILAQWALPDIHWGAQLVSTPAVGNLDDDPELEIVCGSPSEDAGYNSSSGEWINEGFLTVFNIDGTVLPGWPKYTDGIIFSSPVTGDINSDGQCEIIVGLMFAGDAPDYRYGGIYAYDANGNILPGFPFEKGWNFWSAPGLADFDKDGDLEITCSRLGFYSYVIHHDGTLATGWPQQTTWNDYYSTIIGDINNDNIPDILTTAGNGFHPSTSSHGGVYAWNYDGTLLPGFPKATEVDAQAPATITDIDNDGLVEIIASSNWDYDWVTSTDKFRGSLYIWEVDHNYNQSTMEWPTFHHDLQRTGMYPRSLAANANGPYEGVVGESVQFFGTASGGSAPYSWWWDFGDGNTSTLEDPTHTYNAPGLYDITLIVIDDVGAQATDTTTVNITLPILLPVLEIGTPTGGFGVKASVKNTGEAAATNIDWEIALDGKLIFIGKSTTDTIASLAIGANEAIKSKFIFGFGRTNIVVSATCDEGISAEVTKTAFVLGPFVLNVK